MTADVDLVEVRVMNAMYARTVESPCRNCENVHASKEECSRDCDKLRVFQDALLHYDETIIKSFSMKLTCSRDREQMRW
jgi:hypothetical protein